MKKIYSVLLISLSLFLCNTTAINAQSTSTSNADWREVNAYSIGIQAYLYAFPAVYMSYLRHDWITNPNSNFYMAFNQLHLKNELSSPKNNIVGITPNFDTQSVWAWLDLTKEPVILSVPDMGSRYYAFQIADFYSDNFANIGKLSTGSRAGNFAILPPDWEGTLPDNIKESFRSRTPYALLYGRTMSTLEEEKRVASLQRQYKLTTLSNFGKRNGISAKNNEIWAPFDTKQDPMGEWKTINQAMTENPPSEVDSEIIKMMASVGIGPNQPTDFEDMHPSVRKGLERALVDAKKMLRPMATDNAGTGKKVNGWMFPPSFAGRAGLEQEFAYRAAVQSYSNIMYNEPKEAVFMIANTTEDGKKLNGSNNYTIRFARGQEPLAEFWSITLYNTRHSFVANPSKKYAVGNKIKGFKRNSDGTIDIHIQRKSPGKAKEGNWLPAPEGDFYLILRAYAPRKAILEQTWSPPPVKTVRAKK